LTQAGKQAILDAAKCEVFMEMGQLQPKIDPAVTGADVHGRTRGILFDWLSQVHTGTNSPLALEGAPDPQDMLFRTFTHLDVCFAHRPVHRAELQLLGVACSLTATGLTVDREAELSEMASWLASATDGAFTSQQIKEKAHEIRQAFGCELHRPTAYTFLRRYLRKTGWTEQSFSFANYLIELSAMEGRFSKFRPQAVAAAATTLSRQYVSQGVSVRQMGNWKAKLLKCAHVDVAKELAPCAVAMSRLHAAQQGKGDNFVNRKYEAVTMHRVAKVTPNPPPDAAFFVDYFKS